METYPIAVKRQTDKNNQSGMDADVIVDARGHRCPVPVLKAEAALRRARPGARVKVIADDPLAAIDIPFFCREAGHRFGRAPDEAGAAVFVIAKAPTPKDAPIAPDPSAGASGFDSDA